MSDLDFNERAHSHVLVAHRLVQRIHPILARQPPEVIEVVLCDLLATLLAGHRPVRREEILQDMATTVRRLIPNNEAEIFKHHNKPDGWDWA